MIIFIDESGDAGFKVIKGSSESFVIALVIFDDELDAETTSNIINDFKDKHGRSLRYEMKFNKLKKSERLAFLNIIKDCKFRIRTIVVQKESVEKSNLKTDPKFYYKFFLRQLLEHNSNTIEDAKLRLDGFGERKFKKAMNVYLRQNLNKKTKERVIRDIQFVNSKNNSLIQLADMVAGSIHKYYQKNKNDSKIYKQVIKEKIEEEWIFKNSI
jgi:hypothetical protein